MKTKIEYQGGITVPHITGTVNGLLWQVCHYSVSEDGMECLKRVTVKADSIKAVYAVLAEYQDAENLYRVYPYADGIADGDGIQRLADYAVYHVRKFAIANGKAVMAELKRSIWDVEDEKATASLAICEALDENAGLGMDELYVYARRAVERGREKLYRLSEQEYNPEWAMHNPFAQDCIKQTDNAVAELVQYAMTTACLSDKQMAVLTAIADGHSQSDIMAMLDIKATMYKRHRDNGLYKLLQTMLAVDGAVDRVEGKVQRVYWETLERYGLTTADVVAVADMLEEKIKKNKGKKS